MLKGVQRKLIMLQLRESDLFETAYFVLKENEENRTHDPSEMLHEANRILEENSHNGKCSAARSFLPPAMLGFCFGSLLMGCVWLCAVI